MNAPMHKVALVVDRDFGDRVRPLSHGMHVWLIDSPVNRAVAEQVWAFLKLKIPEPHAEGITLFQSPSQFSPEESVGEILDTLVEHHFFLAVLQVHGVRDAQRLESLLAESGLALSSREAEHFVFSRLPPSPEPPSL